MNEYYDRNEASFVLGDILVTRSNVQKLYIENPAIKSFIDYCSEISNNKSLLIDLAASKYIE